MLTRLQAKKLEAVKAALPPSSSSLELPIEFTSTEQVLFYGEHKDKVENCSKLLDPSSRLYQLAEQYRQRLMQIYPEQISAPQRMPFHLELVPYGKGLDPDNQLLLRRAKLLQGRTIRCSWDDLVVYGKAVTLQGPIAEDYGVTHLTIAHFSKGVPWSFHLLQDEHPFRVLRHTENLFELEWRHKTYSYPAHFGSLHASDLLDILKAAEAMDQ